jgi:glycosyltransferase involved in cell wall biosynthesis
VGFAPDVYVLGPRYVHHSGHSGYDGFVQHTDAHVVPSPVSSRYFSSTRGWRVDQALSWLMRRPFYSMHLLRMELGACFTMMRNRKSIFHWLYGDTDMVLSGHLAKTTGVALVASFHEPRVGLEYLGIGRRLVSTLGAVILVSETQREFFEELIQPDRIFVVPHGVDTAFFLPTPRVPSRPQCITVGAKFRDFECLSKAAELVLAEEPEMRFVAVGADRGTEPGFEDPRFVQYSGLSDADLLAQYQNSVVAALPVRRATANNALLEAMACGLPVVASDVDGIREYAGPDAAILTAPGDPESLAAAILQTVRDDRRRSVLSEAGRARAGQYDFRNVARRMTDVYARCADLR